MTSAIDKEKYFHNLDALRFLAFLGVFFSHTLQWQPVNKFLDLVFTFFTFNYLGVPFFFTLSSFLITFNLLKEKLKYGKIGLLRFYTNRALRIWPIYFLMVLFYFFILPHIAGIFHLAPPTLAPIAPFLFFFVNFYVIEHGNNFSIILLILWSISIEEQFYFFWGAAFKYIKASQVVYLFLALIIFSIVFSYYYISMDKPMLTIHTFFVIQNFIPGALLAWIFLLRKDLYERFSKIPAKYMLLAYMAIPLIYLDLFHLDIILQNVIKSSCFGIIIYDQALNDQRLINFGRFRLVNYLGKISYGLYIYHALAFAFLEKKFHFFGVDNKSSLLLNMFQVVITFLITVLMAHLSYQYIELKFLAMKVKRKNKLFE
ncbi:MAG: acyltransferase [Ferruginibacter sp.]